MSYQVEISRLNDVALINLRGTEEAVSRFESVLELAFPRRANAVCAKEGIAVLSLAPDHWWVRTDSGQAESLCERLSAAVAGEHAAVTQVSDHFTGFSVSGEEAVSVLRQGISLDLQQLRTGQCTRCGFARCGATVHVIEQHRHYDLFIESSYADYACTWLAVASGKLRTAP